MGRQKQPEIAERLLDGCTDYALRHGLPDRLGHFATGTGTSSRMLVYHFGTRDELRRAVLRRARQRQRKMFSELIRHRPDQPYLDTLQQAWFSMTGEQGRPYLVMFGMLREDSEQQLWPGFRREATTDWLEPLEHGLASLGRAHQATLALAVIRGLVMDLEATGESERVNRAFADFLQTFVTAALDPPRRIHLSRGAIRGMGAD